MSSQPPPVRVWIKEPLGLVLPFLAGALIGGSVVHATPALASREHVLLPVGLFLFLPVTVWLLAGPDRLTLEHDQLIRTRPLRRRVVLALPTIVAIESGHRFRVGPETVIKGGTRQSTLTLSPQDPDHHAFLLQVGQRIDALGLTAVIRDDSTFNRLGLRHLSPRAPWRDPHQERRPNAD